MKILWCWKCQKDVPMLDEDEFANISDLYSQAISNSKTFRESNTDIADTPYYALFKPLREKYEQITGVKEANHVSIMHHRMSMYGEPCENCGKPLRTPKATMCGVCGWDKDK